MTRDTPGSRSTPACGAALRRGPVWPRPPRVSGPSLRPPRASADPRWRLCGTKPLRPPCRDEAGLTRRLGTPLHDAMDADVEQMPVDHGNQGLKVVAGLLTAPTLDELGMDPAEMGIQHVPAYGPGKCPPVLGAVQRRRPVEGHPRLIPHRRKHELGAALGLRGLWELHGP